MDKCTGAGSKSFEIGGSSETFLDAFLQSGLDILKLSNTQISAQATCDSEGNDFQ